MLRLAGHSKTIHTVFPDMSYVMKYTHQTQDCGFHWFWLDGRRNHSHNAQGFAMLGWRVKPSAASGWRTHGMFCVARLLVVDRYGPLPPRTRVQSVCGLSQCINPEHWRPEVPRPPWRIEAYPDGVWRLVAGATGRPAKRLTVVNVRAGNVVHVLQVAPIKEHILTAPPRAACGLELRPEDLVVTRDLVTCTGGC